MNHDMMWWTPQLHALLGGIVVAVGASVMWEQLAPIWTLIFAAGATMFLWWQGRSIGAIWAWTTLALGIESMTWPIVTMIQIRMGGGQPTEEADGNDSERRPLWPLLISLLGDICLRTLQT